MFNTRLAKDFGRKLKFVRFATTIITDGSFTSIPVPIIKCLPKHHKPLFPHFEQIHEINDSMLVHMLKQQIQWCRPFVGVFMQNNSEIPNDLWKIGTLAQFEIKSKASSTANVAAVHLRGLDRIELIQPIEMRNDADTFAMAIVDKFHLKDYDTGQLYDALTMMIVSTIKSVTEMDSVAAESFLAGITNNRANFHNVEFLCDLSAMISQASIKQMRIMLEESNIIKRMKLAIELLKIHEERVKMTRRIDQRAMENIEQLQQKLMLNEKMNILRKEMGVYNVKQIVIQQCKNIVNSGKIPPEVAQIVNEEIDALQRVSIKQAEYNIICSYLNWLTNFPWNKSSIDNLDMVHARNVLDANHYGMESVKNRILEYMAVAKLRGTLAGKILCFCGAPGIGKTSIAQSIAKALNRRFGRINVGGLCNAVELRGHRRTYTAALPGKIVQTIRATNTINPVILIDEIDKMTIASKASEAQNPGAVLLEILDPEQNKHFHDHYMDVPIDLSNVLFICTANELAGIAEPLLDRMEVIEMNGYSDKEQIVIAQSYLIPKICNECGLVTTFDDSAIERLIHDYCRDAGVRRLSNQLEKIIRKIALQLCRGAKSTNVVTVANLIDFLGYPRSNETLGPIKYSQPGIVTALAHTKDGGDILIVEAVKSSTFKYSSQLKLTGHLGPILRDSAEIALTYARNILHRIDPQNTCLDHFDIHIHIPELSVSKEGPSAGITITTALLSLALNRSVPNALAMTGEISLQGKIMPVGGIREKVLAAQRHDISELIIPYHNRDELMFEFGHHPNVAITNLNMHFVSNYCEIFDMLFNSNKTQSNI